MSSTKRLVRLKEEIETAGSNRDKATGSLEVLLGNLRDTYKCDTLEQAKRKLKKMEKAIGEGEQALETSITEIEEQFNELSNSAASN